MNKVNLVGLGNFMKMVIHIMDVIRMDKEMEKGNIHGLMPLIMMENGSIIIDMEKGNKLMRLEVISKDIGKMIRNMERGNILLRMVIIIVENTKMLRRMAKAD